MLKKEILERYHSSSAIVLARSRGEGKSAVEIRTQNPTCSPASQAWPKRSRHGTMIVSGTLQKGSRNVPHKVRAHRRHDIGDECLAGAGISCSPNQLRAVWIHFYLNFAFKTESRVWVDRQLPRHVLSIFQRGSEEWTKRPRTCVQVLLYQRRQSMQQP